jgi:hypothetical protein
MKTLNNSKDCSEAASYFLYRHLSQSFVDFLQCSHLIGCRKNPIKMYMSYSGLRTIFADHCTGGFLQAFSGSKSELKGTVSRVFLLLVFFMNQFPPSPRVSLGPFQIFSKILGDIPSPRLTTAGGCR